MADKNEKVEEVNEKEENPAGKLRILWRRTFLSIFFVISVGLVFSYFYFTRASFLEKTIHELFARTTNGKIFLKVKKASLFRGFVFEDIQVFSSPEFGEKPLFTVDKFSLLYNVYGFWAGDFGVHEVGIYHPKIYLLQKNNRWNIEGLLKESEAKEKEKKKEEEEKEVREISLPFSLRAFFKFVLKDFAIEANAQDSTNSQPFVFGLENFTFQFYFLTKKINKLPKEPLGYLDLIDTFLVQMNPQEKVEVYFQNPQAASNFPLDLHLLLAFSGDQDPKNFISSMKIGHEDIPLNYKGRHKLPLGLSFQYNMFYDPKKDYFEIKNFQVKILKQLWLNLEGYLANVTKPSNWDLDIRLNKSEINLDGLLPYYQNFTNDKKLRFGGKISLAPLSITGKGGEVLVKGNLGLKKIFAQVADLTVSIPFFDLFYEAKANLQKQKENPLQYARAGWKGNLNNANLGALLIYEPQKKVNAEAFVKNLNVTPFTKGALGGIFNLAFSLKGPKENDLKADFSLNSPAFYYVADRAKSGINKLNFEIHSSIQSPTMAFKKIFIDVPKIYLTLKNRENRDAFIFGANTKVNLEGKNTKLWFNLEELRLHLRNLHPTLPEKNQESLEALLALIRKSIVLKGNTFIEISGKKQNIEHATNFILEDFDIQDIWLKANVFMEPGLIQLQNISLDGLKNSLKMKIHGHLKEGYVQKLDPKNSEKIIKEKGMAPDIQFSLLFAREKLEKIFQDNAIVGSLGISAHFKDNIIKGEFKIKDFSLESPLLTLAQVNLDFPFEHNLLFLKPLNLTAANKERIIKNYHFAEKANFTINYMDIPHPTQEGKKFRLIYPQGSYPGLSAVMRYSDNVFQMPIMQIYILNGLISLQDVIFNVGRAKPKEMEYLLQLQVKDLDLKQLIPPDKAKAINDGSIRLDMLFYGNRLDQPIENLKGYISIYKIGEEFGKQALKVVKPDSGGAVDFVVDNSILVKKMDLDIKEGLIYARVLYQKRIFGQIISPAGDQILQERIPIPEFMQRAGREVQVYQREKEKKPEA